MKNLIMLIPAVFLLDMITVAGAFGEGEPFTFNKGITLEEGEHLGHDHSSDEYLSDEDSDVAMMNAEKARYELFKEHNLEYRDMIKQEIDNGLSPTIQNVKKKGDTERLSELKKVLDDYNDFLNDLDLMSVILDIQNMIKETDLLEYYYFYKKGHEKIKAGFSIKNEIYLNRIDELKDRQARAYGKFLLNAYREYCIFDIDLIAIDIDEDTGKAVDDVSQKLNDALRIRKR